MQWRNFIPNGMRNVKSGSFVREEEKTFILKKVITIILAAILLMGGVTHTEFIYAKEAHTEEKKINENERSVEAGDVHIRLPDSIFGQ